ncbi:hypothetical protein HYW94_01940 [Candidatus Uhrbacteria bacterium]|nr:hypothetical protein [Candidatus Uhrbacteria bacterium]
MITVGELKKFKLNPNGGSIDLGPEYKETKVDIPQEAHTLHNQARTAGGRGEYDIAIDCFFKVHEIAPLWPYPVYDLAYTYLLKQDYENALKYYELTNQLAPHGFFTSKTAADILRKEKEGIYPEGLYTAYLSGIENEPSNQKKFELIQKLLIKAPNFALGYLTFANLVGDEQQKLELIGYGLENDPDTDTRTSLLIAKSIVLDKMRQHSEAVEILGDVIFNIETSKNLKVMAYITLASIVV